MTPFRSLNPLSLAPRAAGAITTPATADGADPDSATPETAARGPKPDRNGIVCPPAYLHFGPLTPPLPEMQVFRVRSHP